MKSETARIRARIAKCNRRIGAKKDPVKVERALVQKAWLEERLKALRGTRVAYW